MMVLRFCLELVLVGVRDRRIACLCAETGDSAFRFFPLFLPSEHGEVQERFRFAMTFNQLTVPERGSSRWRIQNLGLSLRFYG